MGPATGARLTLEAVGHQYGAARVVDSIKLQIEPGEFVTLLGPSGCGKSTLLRILAGLLQQSRGTVSIDGQDVSGLSPADRGVGIVFQNYALFPHMSVEDNVAYGLQAQHLGDRKFIRDTFNACSAPYGWLNWQRDFRVNYLGASNNGWRLPEPWR